ncbi:MAG: AI-2E family transporter [Chloroflexi bacterium]|nr:AI-2E family transporter [Chloroflexota bacterium]
MEDKNRGYRVGSTDEFLRKYWRRIAVIAGAILLLLGIYALRTVFLPFIIALALAYIMLPMVNWIEARFPRKWRGLNGKRISAIAVVYLMVVLVIGVFIFFAINAIIGAIHSLAHNSVDYFASASATLKEWTESLRQITPPGIREQIDTYVQEMGDTLLNSVHSSIMNAMEQIPTQLGFIVGMAAVPFFLFYILKDQEKISGLYSSLPDWAKPHAKSISSILRDSSGRYIRAMLTLALVVGTLTLIGLLIIRAPLAPLLAVVAGVTEMIPMVGPLIGALVIVMVTLALAPEKAVWVAVICLGVQLLENVLLVPRIQAAFFRIHPAITIVLIMLGGYIAGVWGVVLVMPLTATAIGVYKYLSRITEDKTELEEKPPALPDMKEPQG